MAVASLLRPLPGMESFTAARRWRPKLVKERIQCNTTSTLRSVICFIVLGVAATRIAYSNASAIHARANLSIWRIRLPRRRAFIPRPRMPRRSSPRHASIIRPISRTPVDFAAMFVVASVFSMQLALATMFVVASFFSMRPSAYALALATLTRLCMLQSFRSSLCQSGRIAIEQILLWSLRQSFCQPGCLQLVWKDHAVFWQSPWRLRLHCEVATLVDEVIHGSSTGCDKRKTKASELKRAAESDKHHNDQITYSEPPLLLHIASHRCSYL